MHSFVPASWRVCFLVMQQIFIVTCNKAGLDFLLIVFGFLHYSSSYWYKFLTYVRHTFIYFMDLHIFYFSFLYINHIFCFSLHQSHFFLHVLIQMWAKPYIFDNLLHLLLGVVISIDQHDPNWYTLDFCFPLLVLNSANGSNF